MEDFWRTTKSRLVRKIRKTPNEEERLKLRPNNIKSIQDWKNFLWERTSVEFKVALQSTYGIHTFRVESIAHGKAAPVDELQVQGVYNPGLLRKIIVTEASKVIQDVGRTRRSAAQIGEGESMVRVGSSAEGPAVFRSPSKSWKIVGSPRYASVEHRSTRATDLMLHKLEEVSKSVKYMLFPLHRGQL
ncbi:uncharacterized protein LOC114300043 [Camellia sinensis]|uniref:uncharacterized protein LOC114300043 n=1 Tax=Camellia sinensis TaxID=4442 RepID=UPI001035C20F|nr:uncharacterized protein LOC114300043 [Camellia sinensis]